ncbi:MAG: hypothetical protein ACI9R3_004040 [Verrucomicrobiales bacterium]|jgi:hypothetical protein
MRNFKGRGIIWGHLIWSRDKSRKPLEKCMHIEKSKWHD